METTALGLRRCDLSYFAAFWRPLRWVSAAASRVTNTTKRRHQGRQADCPKRSQQAQLRWAEHGEAIPAIGYKASLDQAKKFFFDRQKVTSAFDQAEKKVLSRFGYFTMRDARQSIRNRKNPSRPGSAPTNQTGLLKRLILFQYEPYNSSVVVGPIDLPRMKDPDVPRTLEEGGWAAQHNKDRNGKPVVTRYRMEPRPFMLPAFRKQQAKLPELWRNSL